MSGGAGGQPTYVKPGGPGGQQLGDKMVHSGALGIQAEATRDQSVRVVANIASLGKQTSKPLVNSTVSGGAKQIKILGLKKQVKYKFNTVKTKLFLLDS